MRRKCSFEYRIRRWTKSAMECYLRGCICEGCPIYENYCKLGGWTCQMKAAVLATVQKFGIPQNLIKTDKENLL